MQFNHALSYNIILRSANVVILFFINVLFVRIAGAQTTGNFFYLITILSFITLIVSLSLETGITFFTSKNKDNAASFFWLIIIFSFLQIIVSCLIISVAVKNQTSLSIAFLLMFVISNILISNFTALYISLKWFIAVNTIVLVINFVTLVLLGWIFMQNNFKDVSKAEHIYIASFSAQAIGLVILFFIKSGIKLFEFPSIDIIKKVFNYSFLALAGNISFFLVTRLDYFFVKQFCSSEALGNYVQVSKIGQMFVLLPTMAASVIFPFTISGEENILAKVQWLCRLMTTLIIAAALFIIVFGKWLFPFFFGNDFNLMYPAMLFYLPGIFSLCISSLLASYISGRGHISVNVIASIVALMIVYAGDIIFIPKFGINAAALVSSISYTVCLLVLVIYIIKKYHGRITAFLTPGLTELKYLLQIRNKK